MICNRRRCRPDQSSADAQQAPRGQLGATSLLRQSPPTRSSPKMRRLMRHRFCRDVIAWFTLSAPVFAQFQFGQAVNFPVGGTQIRGLTVADFDGNGAIDVAASNDQGFTSIFLNLGDGTFRPPSMYVLGASSLVAADLNGDGKPDLVSAPYCCGNGFSIVYNRGDGTFAQPTGYPTSNTFGVAVAAGDFAHEGRARVAALSVTYFGGGPTIDVWKNRGDGTLVKVQTFAASGGAQSLTVADVNQDGYLDLISGDGNGGSTFTVYLNKKDGTFSAGVPYNANSSPGLIAPGDLNKDGAPDLLWSWEGYFYLSLNKGNGTFTAPPSNPFQSRSFLGATAIADFNQDGKPDAAATTYSDSAPQRRISIFPGNGDGTFGSEYVLPIVSTETPNQILAADLNGDGKPDLIYDGNPNPYFVVRLTPGATNIPPSIIGTNQGGNSGSVTIQVFYQGLIPGTTVKVSAPGLPDILPTSTAVSSYSPNVLIVTFDLTGSAPGVYNLVLTKPDSTSSTLANAFTVIQGGYSDIWVDLIGRTALRAGLSQTYYIVIGNRGNLDAYSAEIWLQIPSPLAWDADAPFRPSRSVTGADGYTTLFYDIAGLMSAGTSSTIPVRLIAPDNPAYAHMLFHIGLSETQPQ